MPNLGMENPISNVEKENNENDGEDMDAIFKKLKELDKKENLTEEDVKWFAEADIGSAFRSLEELLHTGREGEEADEGGVERLNDSELLYRRVTAKVEEWERDNLE